MPFARHYLWFIDNPMSTIEWIRAFDAVVKTGGFTSAATMLNTTPQLVSKYVRALEDEFEVKLLHRTTRKVSLTEQGRTFQSQFTQLVEDFDSLKALARNEQEKPQGRLVISAPVTFSESFLVTMISQFTEQFPDVTVDIRLSDRYIDLVEEGIDVALRIGRMQDSNLIARKLTDLDIVICAHPDYLTQRGAPKSADDFKNHDCIVDTNFRFGSRWPLRGGSIPVDGRFRINSASAARQLALEGRGLLLTPRFVINDDLMTGALSEVMPGSVEPTLGLYAVYLERRLLAGRIRAFIDFIAENWKDHF